MIALAILLIAVAIVYPNIFPPKTALVPSESEVIERARSLAIARAEMVRLAVARDGSWEIVAESVPNDILASGQLAEAPAAEYSLRVNAVGACLPVTAERPVEGAEVDAVSCSKRP
jgi:hypothetical protein